MAKVINLAYNKAEDASGIAVRLEATAQAMQTCAAIAEQRGYNEVNINVGCPSDRVKKWQFLVLV